METYRLSDGFVWIKLGPPNYHENKRKRGQIWHVLCTEKIEKASDVKNMTKSQYK